MYCVVDLVLVVVDVICCFVGIFVWDFGSVFCNGNGFFEGCDDFS